MGDLSWRRSVSYFAQQECSVSRFWHGCDASFARACARGESVEFECPKTGGHELVADRELYRQLNSSSRDRHGIESGGLSGARCLQSGWSELFNMLDNRQYQQQTSAQPQESS